MEPSQETCLQMPVMLERHVLGSSSAVYKVMTAFAAAAGTRTGQQMLLLCKTISDGQQHSAARCIAQIYYHLLAASAAAAHRDKRQSQLMLKTL
jgi:hypothetical protein